MQGELVIAKCSVAGAAEDPNYRQAVRCGRHEMIVDERPVGREARTPQVSRAVSGVSAHKGVRRELVRHQREIEMPVLHDVGADEAQLPHDLVVKRPGRA